MPGNIIILHMCTINENHIMHGSSDMEHDRQNLLSFWTNFCTFTPLKTQKIKILKKWKKNPGDIIILHMCAINENHIMYGSWDMERGRQNFLSFWTNFCTFTPLKTKIIKILKKMKKNPGDIIILHMCILNDNNIIYGSWNTKCNGQNSLSFFGQFFALVPSPLPP